MNRAERVNKFLSETDLYGYKLTESSIKKILEVDWLIEKLEISKEQLKEFLSKNRVLSEEFDFLLSSSGELEWIKPVIRPPLKSKEEKILDFLRERIRYYFKSKGGEE